MLWIRVPEIFSKKQVDYIYRYLKDLGAASVILEKEYIDRDYLDDFSKFYVRRFNSHSHKCARLHFVRESWNHAAVENLLAHADLTEVAEFSRGYLGYMIVKPLPQTFIGRTCLQIYESVSKDAVLTRPYNINFFGLDLSIDSVAFQEQDDVVSACATTAIWSVLHAAKWVPLQDIPSCSQITIDAINFITGSSNSFPSTALTNKQILRALDVAGMRHHQHSLRETSQEEALELIGIYIASGMPLFLGGDVYNISGSPTRLDRHAITVVGLRAEENKNAFFVHDDRLGPFARANVTATPATLLDSQGQEQTPEWSLEFQEKNDDGEWAPPMEVFVPTTLVCATHRKVGLPLRLCLNTCKRLVTIYNYIRKQAPPREGVSNSNDSVEFSIRLRQIGEIKSEIFKSALNAYSPEEQELLKAADLPNDAEESRLSILTASLAKYQWSAVFKYNSHPAFLVLFDATDVAQGDAVSAVHVLDPKGAIIISAIKRAAKISGDILLGREDTFLASFLRRVTPAATGLTSHLDAKYGPPRAPSQLKPQEV